jgi:hypothetical protein
MLCATEKPEYGIIAADIIKKRWVKVQQHSEDLDRTSLKISNSRKKSSRIQRLRELRTSRTEGQLRV